MRTSFHHQSEAQPPNFQPVELASPNTPSTAIPLSRAFSILFYVQCPPFRSTLSL
jgi:hypothetical protein